MTQQATKQAVLAEGKPQPTAAGPGQEEIAALAYQLWEAKGCPVGTSEEDWFNAEAALAKKISG